MHAAVGSLVLLVAAALPGPFAPYVGKGDHFSVELPGTPKVEKTKNKKDNYTTHTYTLDVDDGIYTVIVLTDAEFANYSDEDVQNELNGFRDAEKKNGKLLSEKKVMLGTFPGLEIQVQGKDMDFIARKYVTKSASYKVVVDWDHGKTAKDVDADRFLGSLTLLDDKGGVVAKAGGATAPPAAGPTPPSATPTPAAVTGPTTVHDFVVTAVGAAPKKYGIAMKWLTDVKSDAADASIEVKAQCWMPDGKTHKLKKSVAVPKGSLGKSVDLELKLVGMPSEAKKCTLGFNWVAGGKTEQLDLECWPGAGGEMFGGPCDGGA